MLKTSNLITTIEQVPREWVFEFYLKLNQRLKGQDVRLKSPFNLKDKNPSFFVYYSNHKQRYLFKDFSMDYQGDGTEFVMRMFSLTTRGEAAHKIMHDYNNYLKQKGKDKDVEFKVEEKWKVIDWTTRNWNTKDQSYWTRYRIGSTLLEKYNVKALESYTMQKENETRTYSSARAYGFFRADGTLYKIYQPMMKENKFLKVRTYIQGTDQLTFKVPYLVICSSLKDMMAFEKLGLKNVEMVAPDSENVIIPKEVIESYKLKYKNICTIFDNDAAGIRSMQKYEDAYGIATVHFQLEKDIADAVEKHGIKNTLSLLYPLLTKALTGKSKML